MKKIGAFLITIFLTAGLGFAELYPTSRYVELGIDLTAGADENVMPISEILVKDLVIDFSKIADSLGDDGMVINGNGDADFFFNLNFGKKFSMGSFIDLDLSARLGMSKDLFELLGSGNEVDTPIVASVNAGMEMYAEIGAPVKINIGKFGIKVTPSYFLPIVYMPQPKAAITTTLKSDGTITAEGVADFSVYSLFNMGAIFDSNFNFIGASALTNSLTDTANVFGLMQEGGFDLTAEVEYPLVKSLDVGVYTRVPVVQSKLKYVTSGTVTYNAALTQSLLESYTSGGSVSYTTDGPTFSGVSFNDNTYGVNRPFRLGAEGAWRPFGKWCTFRPLVGVAARNPFGDDFNWKTSVYPEYSLGVDMRFFYVIGLNFSTSYTKQIFAQTAGFTFNLRVFELDVKVASTSASFVDSWLLSGATAFVGIRAGF